MKGEEGGRGLGGARAMDIEGAAIQDLLPYMCVPWKMAGWLAGCGRKRASFGLCSGELNVGVESEDNDDADDADDDKAQWRATTEAEKTAISSELTGVRGPATSWIHLPSPVESKQLHTSAVRMIPELCIYTMRVCTIPTHTSPTTTTKIQHTAARGHTPIPTPKESQSNTTPSIPPRNQTIREE